LLREFIRHILQCRARLVLSRHPGVKIHPTAKVNFRGVRLHVRCSLEIGEGTIVEGSLLSEREGSQIAIGKNTFIGNSIIASAGRIEIGDDVLISGDCYFLDHNSHAIGWEYRKQDVKDWYHGKKDWTHVDIKSIKIGDKSWIGLNAIILKSVEIGEGAIVAAGSVVTKSVPPWTVVGGNPARVIREIPIEDR